MSLITHILVYPSTRFPSGIFTKPQPYVFLLIFSQTPTSQPRTFPYHNHSFPHSFHPFTYYLHLFSHFLFTSTFVFAQNILSKVKCIAIHITLQTYLYTLYKFHFSYGFAAHRLSPFASFIIDNPSTHAVCHVSNSLSAPVETIPLCTYHCTNLVFLFPIDRKSELFIGTASHF